MQQQAHLQLPTQALPPVPKPEKYGEDPAKCRGFLMRCCLYSSAHASMNEVTKLTHFMYFLTDKALPWATALRQGENNILGRTTSMTSLFPSSNAYLIAPPTEKK